MKNVVYLLLGSNLADKGRNILYCREQIEQHTGAVKLASAIYQTKPWGFDSPDLFLNQVLCVYTDLNAVQLLEKILDIEKQMGRTREGQGYQSRIIDIDILFFNDEVIDTPQLVIPHPRLHLRNFALVPMAEIAPGHVHPVLKKTIAELAIDCPDNNFVVPL